MTALYFHIAGATYADLLGTLQEMGPLTVRMAAERQDEESIRKLDTYISERPAHVHYQSGYLEVYSGFYSMIAEMTGNPILNMAASALAGLFLDRLGSLEIGQELQDQFLGDQMAVAEFIRSGYVGRAVQLITEHLQRFAQLIAVKDPALLNEVVTWS
jgi:DNA-binding FadR family transcriptional regulator